MNNNEAQNTSESLALEPLAEVANKLVAETGQATPSTSPATPPAAADTPSQNRANEAKLRTELTTEKRSPKAVEADAATTENIYLELRAMQASFDTLNQQIHALARNQEILQSAVRQLVTRVADAASSLAAPRMRELYLRLLMIYDLVNPVPAQLSEDAACVCNMIAVQIEQFLAVNGFERISSDDVVFDPKQHKLGKIELVDDPELDGRILTSLQHGFCSQQSVLRPATVVMGRVRERLRDSATEVPVPGSTPKQENQVKDDTMEETKENKES
jgi:molecular chaperone GrpE (heat shock protein)